MTDQELRAIDARVVEQVMGWTGIDLDGKAMINGHPGQWTRDTGLGLPPNDTVPELIPHYSTDISAAWLVIEALAKSPHWIGVIVGTFGIPHAKCYRDSKLVSEEWIDLIDVPDPRSLSERCALAICLAALKAVEETQEGAS